MVVGDFAGEDTVFFELAADDTGIADDFAGVFFGGFLGFGIVVEVINSVLESGRGDIVEESSESGFLVVSEVPDDEGDAKAVLEDGIKGGEVIEGVVINCDHADVFEALHFGGREVFEKPGGEFGGKESEILAGSGSEGFKAAFFGGAKIDEALGFLEGARKKTMGSGDNRMDFGVGGSFRKSGSCFFGDFEFGGDDFGGFEGLFAGRALVETDPTLTKPETNFFVAILFAGGHLEEINLGFLAVVEVVDDDISEFGDGAGADIAADIVFVFIHEKENVGAVEILVKRSINIGDFGGVIVVEGDWGGVVDDFVALAFEIAVPIVNAVLKLGTACNDEFFHELFLDFPIVYYG